MGRLQFCPPPSSARLLPADKGIPTLCSEQPSQRELWWDPAWQVCCCITRIIIVIIVVVVIVIVIIIFIAEL